MPLWPHLPPLAPGMLIRPAVGDERQSRIGPLGGVAFESALAVREKSGRVTVLTAG